MVETATNLGRNGLQDWLIQRITAIILAVYTIFLISYFITHPALHYDQWRILFESHLMRYSTLLALLSLIAHAWIGVWTVITDYIKPLFLRLLLQVIILLSLLVCFIWGIQIIWRI